MTLNNSNLLDKAPSRKNKGVGGGSQRARKIQTWQIRLRTLFQKALFLAKWIYINLAFILSQTGMNFWVEISVGNMTVLCEITGYMY